MHWTIANYAIYIDRYMAIIMIYGYMCFIYVFTISTHSDYKLVSIAIKFSST